VEEDKLLGALRGVDDTKPKWRFVVGVAAAIALNLPVAADAEALKVLTAGAFKQVLLSAVPQFEKDGQAVQLDTDTVGGLVKRIQEGERFDLVIASPAALETLSKAGKVTNEVVNLARVGVGVGIRADATKPDISTVENFKHALLNAKAISYVDPASGGQVEFTSLGCSTGLVLGKNSRQSPFSSKVGFPQTVL
jgi:molybdate transport system substrate-binding protein